MDFSKINNKLLIVLCVLVVFLPFYLITPVLADSEAVEGQRINGIAITQNSNYFTENSTTWVYSFELEKGYRYTLTNDSNNNRNIAFSIDYPAINVVYDYIMTLNPGDSYTFISNNNFNYFYISGSAANYTMTREKVTSMDGAVGDLVDNVGINSIWSIFDISINYIVIVVLVAFGLFIIFRIIRKISKGKEGF